MHEPKRRLHIARILLRHFFSRFFDNDTLRTEGDTTTTVVRALAVIAVPGLMIAFFLQNQYPKRSLWGSIEDQYFFVLFSFVVMGAVSIFEWEMLFPDRLDFLILSPLSIKPAQMLAGKAGALCAFLLLFLFGANVFGTLMLPLVSHGNLLRQVVAHAAAVGLAGAFAALLFLALGGSLLCCLSLRQFRVVSPLVQMVTVAVLALLMLQYARFGSSLPGLLAEPLGGARWMPPFWFLGVYERLLHGSGAPAFAGETSRYAVRATLLVAAVALVTYPIAWARMRRLAIEGMPGGHRPSWQPVTRGIHRMLQRPGQRAVFHFIGQTMARNNRYQVYLAMYCGSGLALAIACATTFRMRANGTAAVHPSMNQDGLHVVMPLLLFWVIAGLRTAFAFPLSLSAGWIFRVTGVNLSECAGAARRWVFGCAAGLMGCVLVILRFAGWDARHLVVQLGCGLCLCVLLVDGFFFSQSDVPFNRARLPGKTNLPLMLTLYVGVLPPFLFGMIALERQMERNLGKLLPVLFLTAALHVGLSLWRQAYGDEEEQREEYEGEFQLLGLSFQ